MALPTCFATVVEKRRPLPADALIPDSIFTSTHAITIDAPPEQVWPWIAQMGAGRAGWYSWDAIDNGAVPSATRVIPQLQTVAPGDIMPAVPGAEDAFIVAAVDPHRDLVLTVPDGHGGNAVAWEHILEPLDDGQTRLIVRGRASSHWLDLARAKPPAGHRRLFIERAYAVLARLPRPLLIGFAAFGHRFMEARHLRGIQRRSTAASERREVSGEAWRKALLACGIASSLLYGVMIGAIRFEGYSLISQVPSELTAIGASTRSLWMRLGAVYTVLVAAFGWGVWKSAGRSRAVHIVGGLIWAYGSLGLLWPFASMHQREVLAAGGATLSDSIHVVLGGVTVLLMFLAIGFGATAFGKRFRFYSIASIVVLLAFGALTFLDAPRLQVNLPTPWIGLWERINISVFLLWVVVLATALLRSPGHGGRDTLGNTSRPSDQRLRNVMPDVKIARITGWFGVACVALTVGQFPLWLVGSPPSVYDGAGFAQHLFNIKNIAFTRILMDQGIYVSMLVFAAGLRHLIRQARSETEWIGTLLFGAAIGWVVVTVVADGLEGGAVLDTLNGNPDPSAVRALIAGTLLIYNGAIAFAITGLFLASAAWATFESGVLPRWTGFIAAVGATLCAASVPAMYGGPVDYTGFYNAGGWGPAIVANFPPMIWFLTVSVILIRRRPARGVIVHRAA